MNNRRQQGIYHLEKPRDYKSIGQVHRPNYNYHHLGLQRPRNYDNVRVRNDRT